MCILVSVLLFFFISYTVILLACVNKVVPVLLLLVFCVRGLRKHGQIIATRIVQGIKM